MSFFGTIGARNRTSASACSRPVSAAPPRSKYSRIDGTSSSYTVSPSTRPTLPSSNVTSFTRATSATRRRSPRSRPVGRRDRTPSRSHMPRRRASPACTASSPRTRTSAAARQRRASAPDPRAPDTRCANALRAQPGPPAAVPKGLRRARRAQRARLHGRGTHTTAACSRARRESRPTPRRSRVRAARSAGRCRGRPGPARARAATGDPARSRGSAAAASARADDRSRRRPAARAGPAAVCRRRSRLHDLPEGILAHDLVAAERPQIAAANLQPLTLDRRPGQHPFGRAAVAGDEMLVLAVVDVGDAGEAGAEPLADLRLAHEPTAPRIRTARGLEYAVVREQRHDRVEVVAVETVEHAQEHIVLRLLAHATPHTACAARAYTSAVFTSPSMARFSPSSASGSPLDV